MQGPKDDGSVQATFLVIETAHALDARAEVARIAVPMELQLGADEGSLLPVPGCGARVV